jgi:hypothetical protein
MAVAYGRPVATAQQARAMLGLKTPALNDLGIPFVNAT